MKSKKKETKVKKKKQDLQKIYVFDTVWNTRTSVIDTLEAVWEAVQKEYGRPSSSDGGGARPVPGLDEPRLIGLCCCRAYLLHDFVACMQLLGL